MNKQVKESLLVLSVLSASSSALAIDPAPVDLGGFNMIPTLTLSTGYDDNPFSVTDSAAVSADGSVVTTVNPNLLFVAKQGENSYSANFSITRGIFHDSTDDNYTDYDISLGTELFFNSKNGLALSAAQSAGHENRGSGSTQGVSEFIRGPVEFDDTVFSALYTYGSQSSQGRLQFSADYLSKTFDNFQSITRDRERDEYTLGVKFLYAIGADTDLTAKVSSTTIDYDNQQVVRRDSNETEYFVGLEWQATAKTSGYASIGVGDKEFDSIFDRDGSLRADPDTEVAWDVGVVWEPRSYSSVTFSTSREEEETVSTGNFIDQTSYGVSWDHGWNDRFSTNLFYNFLNQEYVGSLQDDDIDTFGASLTYAYDRWLDVSLSYDYSDKASSVDLLDFDRSKIILSFDVSL